MPLYQYTDILQKADVPPNNTTTTTVCVILACGLYQWHIWVLYSVSVTQMGMIVCVIAKR